MDKIVLPMDVNSTPWLHRHPTVIGEYINIGKWMLFFDNESMNEAWILANKLYSVNELEGVISMKCSTKYINPRSNNNETGIVILYCSDSHNEQKIINIGKNILEMFNYKQQKRIYYKTDLQTHMGTRATGSTNNYTYQLQNHLYKSRCLINLDWN